MINLLGCAGVMDPPGPLPGSNPTIAHDAALVDPESDTTTLGSLGIGENGPGAAAACGVGGPV